MVRFNYRTLDELKADIAAQCVEIAVQEDLSPLSRPMIIHGKTVPNRIALNPMEGCDGEFDGTPSDLTRRRYERFARGGAGLIWMEACAVKADGRANPRQLMLNEDNLEAYTQLVSDIKRWAVDSGNAEPVVILQLTHSGRYSKPEGKPAAIKAWHNDILDVPTNPGRIITDEELDELIGLYVKSAVLAAKAGFDGVDIKACHKYLISELLGSWNRPGKYGGDFDGRTRFLRTVIRAVKSAVPEDLIIATRINAYDRMKYPFGWGSTAEGEVDLGEIERLAPLLREDGVELIDITGGNPYFTPHMNRPYDGGGYRSSEHQLRGVNDLHRAASAVQKAVPGVPVVASGFSWLREYGANVAAALIENGNCAFAGFGRQSFAYPDFAKDILAGGMDRNKCCVCCSKCTHIMRDSGVCTGCVVRDSATYLPIYRAGREGKPPIDEKRVAEHV